MTGFHKQWISLVLAVILLSACNRIPVESPTLTQTVQEPNPPTATETRAATVEPEATGTPTLQATVSPTEVDVTPVVTVGNANKLQQFGELEFENPEQLDWSADGQVLAVHSREKATFYDVQKQVEISSIAFGESEPVLDACADTGMVAVSSDQKTILIYEADSGSVDQTLHTPGMLYNASFSPDGEMVAVPVIDEIVVEMYAASTGELQGRLSGFETAAPLYGAEFSSDGQYLLWVSRGIVQPMELSSGQLGPVFGHQEFVVDMAMAPGGRILAVATAGTLDGEFVPLVQVWDTVSGADLKALPAGDEIPAAVDFSPDGRLLVSASGMQLQVWNVEDWSAIQVIPAHSDRIANLAFSPDGRMLASLGADNTVRLWRVSP